MNISNYPPSSRNRQLGAASIAVAMLIMLILVAAVTAVLNMSGSSVVDAAKNEEQVAALFLAEGGVERAQATIAAASSTGTYTNQTCCINGSPSCTTTGGLPSGLIPLGSRGNFQYTSATSVPTPCGGLSPCTKCSITVDGKINNSVRTIRTELNTTMTSGVSGCGDNFSLGIPSITGTGAAVITNVAFRAKGGGACSGGSNSNADVTVCVPSNGSCDTGAWYADSQGTNAVLSKGVSATPIDTGSYSLSMSLTAVGSAIRSYSATALLFYPCTAGSSLPCNIGSPEKVTATGAFAQSGKTSAQTGLEGVVLEGWTCNPSSSTISNMKRAADSDTLVLGFSALPLGPGQEASLIKFGDQPLFKKVELTNSNADKVYSQMWLTYNPGYFPDVGANSRAIFVAGVGAVVQGCIGEATSCVGSTPTCSGSGTTLQICSVASGAVRKSDTITGGSGLNAISIGTTITDFVTGSGGTGMYTVTPAQERGDIAITAASNVLRVSAITPAGSTSTGRLTDQDIVTTMGNRTLSYTSLSVTGMPAGTSSTGDYRLSGPQQTLSGGTDIANQQTNGSYIVVTGATHPIIGTALGISNPSSTSPFTSNPIAGTMTSPTTLSVSGTQPNVGDAIFGSQVDPGTRITARPGATTYTVTPAQTVLWTDTVLARTAVRGIDSGAPEAPTAAAYYLSYRPTRNLSSSDQLCGGVCPFFSPISGAGSNKGTEYSISGLTSGRDWASGFVCLQNADPANIQYLIGTGGGSTKGTWTEPVR